jgi:hypothetical protein
MDYGYARDELRSEIARQSGCRDVTYDVQGAETVGSMTLDRYRYHVACPGSRRIATYLGYRGRVLVSLGKARVYRLVERNAG